MRRLGLVLLLAGAARTIGIIAGVAGAFLVVVSGRKA
jgi:hypothetical protein